MTTQATNRMPVMFVGHGSPMNALSRNHYTDAWRRMAAATPKPKAVLCISAHWYTQVTAVTVAKQPRTIHDFGGFPRALFDVQYPAPGAPWLADRIRDVLTPIDVYPDQSWGLDHGAWSVLVHMFPQADVPVVQLSIDGTQSPQFHYDLAARLAPLRDEGVLIIGSGSVVHNLNILNFTPNASPFDWAVRFNERVRSCLTERTHGALIAYELLGQDAHLSVPTPDHFLPLLYAARLQEADEPLSFAVDGIEYGSVGMLAVLFGGTVAAG